MRFLPRLAVPACTLVLPAGVIRTRAVPSLPASGSGGDDDGGSGDDDDGGSDDDD